MTEKEIEKRLKQYAASIVSPKKKEARIEELLQVKPLPRTRGNLGDFILEQIGYLGRYCLVWQILWIALFIYLMNQDIPQIFEERSGNEMLVLLSLLPPILVLLTVGEITKIYQRSMLEIEQVTKYSLETVVTLRMLILCVFHSMVLAAGIICLHNALDSGVEKLLIYGFTPMILMTGILLRLMQHFQGESLKAASLGLYGLTVMFATLGNTKRFDFYAPSYFKIWCLFFIIGIIFELCQFVSLKKALANFERRRANAQHFL